jgi:signal transduction histidine kinase/CheY-like chemotaxis protein
VFEIIDRAIGQIPEPFSRVPLVLLLAQPVMTLRLAAQTGPMPRWLIPVAFAAFVLVATPFALLSELSTPMILAAVAVFVVTDVTAAAYLAKEGLRRVGSARFRLLVAALSTVLIAIAIVFVAAAATAEEQSATAAAANVVSRFFALFAALGYVLAFVPPRWMRRLWEASTSYGLGQALLRTPADAPEESLWQQLATAAREVTASSAAVIIRCDPDDTAREIAAAGVAVDRNAQYDAAEVNRLVAATRDFTAREPRGGEPIRASVVRRAEARFVNTISLPQRDDLAIVLASRHYSLFGDDDRRVVEGLTALTVLLAERRRNLADQERLAEELAVTVEALKSASQAKSDFLASMSHELRTPLSAIIGFSELMRNEPGDDAQASVPREWIEHVNRSGSHLLSLINDVLDLTKVEAGRLELQREPLDLRIAVGESIAGLRPLADRKSLRLVADVEPATIAADRGRFRQILYNLLSNAIKFTPAGGTVTVIGRPTGRTVSIAVADTGIGIAPEDQAAVFEEFRQVGDPEARQAGTGLGLALTRRLVEAHGGEIALDSAPGRGTTFTVTMPRADERSGALSVPEPARPVLNRRGSVMVIEDDPGAQRLLRTYLESAGYEVRLASDGETAIKEIAAAPPAAVILDVLLPGLDGWEVLRRLKEASDLRDIPVLIVTVVDEREVGLALGAVDYFVKPVDREALLARLARYTFTTKVRQGRVRVLAIDDDPTALEMIDKTLRPEGFEVVSVSNGREALDIARHDSIDLVICDLLMPEIDGFAVVAGLRAHPRTRDIPILVLTGHDVTEADKARLNGNILGVVGKGATAEQGLREWLRRVSPATAPPSGTPVAVRGGGEPS